MSLEDKLNENGASNGNMAKGRVEPIGGLEKKTEELDRPSGIFRIAWDIAKYTPTIAASAFLFGSAVTLSTAIPSVGYALGAWRENKKNKVKTTWRRLKKELYSGNIMGHFDYALFSTPELMAKAFPSFFDKSTLNGKIATLFAFNPIVVIPYNMAYQAFTYFRDNVGLKKTITGMFNGKIATYLKDAYNNKIKKEIVPDTWNVMKYMLPLHAAQLYMWESPTMRMLQSFFVKNPIYRVIMGKKKKKHDIENKQRGYDQNPDWAYGKNQHGNSLNNYSRRIPALSGT